MRLEDGRSTYGWISITLHWVAGIVIMAMLVIGSRVVASQEADRAGLLNTHTTIGVLAYPLLWVRICWRLKRGHPGPLPSQSRMLHLLGRITHYTMIGGLALMLLSGPLTAWSGGMDIAVFGHAVVPGSENNSALFPFASTVHHVVGLALLLMVLLHIAAAIKHMSVDRDGTIEKILIPGDDREVEQPTSR